MPPPPPSTSSKPKSEWVETETGNKVSRRAQLHGTQHITLGGRCVIHPTACLRGDLVRPAPVIPPLPTSTTTTTTDQPPARKQHPLPSITLGKYSILSSSTLLKPPLRLSSSSSSSAAKPPPQQSTATSLIHTPQHIGSHTYIAPSAVVEAAQIGDRVVVGEGAV
ncbi:MAG: hypothetical protein Q9216_005733, partial [Gyalolechia sp. 2 TL-2023]